MSDASYYYKLFEDMVLQIHEYRQHQLMRWNLISSLTLIGIMVIFDIFMFTTGLSIEDMLVLLVVNIIQGVLIYYLLQLLRKIAYDKSRLDINRLKLVLQKYLP